ncbi:MAG: hypothetical protein E7349_00140 [Clostridiales bacterium]|nr:hypothetical protein [Clostridiales bacterium]
MDIVCLQIDLARQKENISFIKSYVDFAALNGYNALLVYLENVVRTDDTQYFAKETTYSQDEIKEIVAYAELKGIEVIPAFENLGHLEKFFAYPALENLSECEDEAKEGRGFSSLKRGTCGCTMNPDLYVFLDKYITDVCSCFKSKYVHIGLDEPFDFAVCARCKAELEKGRSKADLFYEHVMHSYQLITGLGKRMMMWDDFFEYADIAHLLPRDIIFCNWNYMYVDNEPAGHWTNRIKRDWFRYYESLGFSYIFCTYAHGASCTYNVDTFTNYANKYNPIGAIMTSWDKPSSFYFGSYPLIAYAGALWNGNCTTKSEKIKIYAQFLGNENRARLLLSLNIPAFYSGYTANVIQMSENGYFPKYMLTQQLQYAVEEVRTWVKEDDDSLQNNIVTDIYDYLERFHLGLRVENLGEELFDAREGKSFPERYFSDEILDISQRYDFVERNEMKLWNIYRQDIVSCNNAFQNRRLARRAQLQQIEKHIKNKEERGILYTDLMLHDGYCTVKMEIRVKYEQECTPIVVYSGGAKSSMVGFDLGGCYGFRFLIENQPIEWLEFSVSGEGALYPLNFRYLQNGEKYVASEVEILQGRVENIENVLYNDTRFAVMGYEDGIAHFNDIMLAKRSNSVKIKFQKLAEINEK